MSEKITIERDPNRAVCTCGWTYPPKDSKGVAVITDVRQHATWHRQSGHTS